MLDVASQTTSFNIPALLRLIPVVTFLVSSRPNEPYRPIGGMTLTFLTSVGDTRALPPSRRSWPECGAILPLTHNHYQLMIGTIHEHTNP